MNITPDMWPADTEALRTRIARLEAQSEARRLQVAYWQERARVMESKRDEAIRIQNEFRKERNKAEARIQAVRDVLDKAHDEFEQPDEADILRALGSDTSPGQ